MNCTRTQLRQEWLAALRSGEFEQGIGCLEDDGKYCCLGVACVIAKRHGVFVHTDEGHVVGELLESQDDVIKAFGFQEDAGGHIGGKMLSEINDAKVPFAKIADMVEEHPEGVWE